MKDIKFLCLMLVFALLFCACSAGRASYKVDYGGEKALYTGALDSYASGSTVTLYCAEADADTQFFLNGQLLSSGYDEEKGAVIEFTMPQQDVVLLRVSSGSPELPEDIPLDKPDEIPEETDPDQPSVPDIPLPTEPTPNLDIQTS